VYCLMAAGILAVKDLCVLKELQVTVPSDFGTRLL
jgi:hypothetical protein